MGRLLRVARAVAYGGFAGAAGLYVYCAWAADVSHQRLFVQNLRLELPADALVSAAAVDALRDRELQRLLAEFILRLLASRHVEEAVVEMLRGAVFSEELRPAVALLGREVLVRLMREAHTHELLARTLLRLAADQRFLSALTAVIEGVLRNPRVQRSVADVACRLMGEPVVQEKLAQVGAKHVLHIMRNADEYARRHPLVREVIDVVEQQIDRWGAEQTD